MKETLAEINELRRLGIIGKSAIGGAMGATFYLEPVSTFDLDIFVLFAGAPLILTLAPIYEFLTNRGHKPEGDAIVIHGWPVQFLPAEGPLLREAVERAQAIDFEGVETQVMTPEHLMAIALKTGRAKDFARLVAFVEAKVAKETILRDILERHSLSGDWQKFEQRYLKSP